MYKKPSEHCAVECTQNTTHIRQTRTLQPRIELEPLFKRRSIATQYDNSVSQETLHSTHLHILRKCTLPLDVNLIYDYHGISQSLGKRGLMGKVPADSVNVAEACDVAYECLYPFDSIAVAVSTSRPRVAESEDKIRDKINLNEFKQLRKNTRIGTVHIYTCRMTPVHFSAQNIQ